jgi:hypothetical protein
MTEAMQAKLLTQDEARRIDLWNNSPRDGPSHWGLTGTARLQENPRTSCRPRLTGAWLTWFR